MSIDVRYLCPMFQVFDMPASLAFYRDTLGFEIVETAPPRDRVARKDDYGWVWLRHGEANLMLNTLYDPEETRPPVPDASRVEAHGDTALYIGCPDVGAVYDHLLAKGMEVDAPTIASYGMKQLYLDDPDGYTVCFQWPAEVARS